MTIASSNVSTPLTHKCCTSLVLSLAMQTNCSTEMQKIATVVRSQKKITQNERGGVRGLVLV